ncbi:GIP [Symbiodinium sp. CCMP2592]|nr:GIP [Symbiodinium sp. CCMP2592]
MDLNLEDLRKALRDLGEDPSPSWTKVELRYRLQELTGKDTSINVKTPAKDTSPMLGLVKKLNAASRKKQDLVTFCRDEISMDMSGLENKTIAQLQMLAMKQISSHTAPHPTDLLGFGKHVRRTYLDVAQNEKEYCSWVKTTAEENPHNSDPRLRRFARWLQLQEDCEILPEVAPKKDFTTQFRPAARNSSTKKSTEATNSASASSSSEAMNQQMMATMFEMIKDLRGEIAELKGEPVRKKGVKPEESGTETDGSYAMVTVQKSGAIETLNFEGDEGSLGDFDSEEVFLLREEIVLPNGAVANGQLHDIRHRLVAFSPKAWHGPEDWNAHPEILKMALPPKWHTVSTDIGHWKHPKTGEVVQFMLIIDEGAAACLQYLREGWGSYFGLPRALRLDPAGAFRSQSVVDFCDREHILLDIVAADAHWQIGVCEQAIKGVKEVMSKMCDDDDQATPETLLATAVSVFNQRDQVRGFSPVQHAFGRSPDITGRIVTSCAEVPDDLIVECATAEFERSYWKLCLVNMDVSEEGPTDAEWYRAQDVQEVPESAWSAECVSFWEDQSAAVEVEIDMPNTARQWERATANLSAYFTGAMKRQAVEVSEKRLSPQELAQFKEAKMIEVKNFLAAKAFEVLPKHLQPSKEQAIGMRWNEIVRKIKERFHWGDWDCNEFIQCGVKDSKAATTGWEKTQLRALLGALSWHAQQANQLLQSTRARKGHRMLIHGSPGAAETQAAVNGEDQLVYARYQWSEILYGNVDTKDPDTTVRRTTGCVISDSRNVYDKLQTEVLSIKGAEKRANLELLALKEAQSRTNVHIRWVHSEAQLANTLTKANGGRELELFYRMGHQWRIVEDDRMRSARKRKAEGMSPLQQESTAVQTPEERD